MASRTTPELQISDADDYEMVEAPHTAHAAPDATPPASTTSSHLAAPDVHPTCTLTACSERSNVAAGTAAKVLAMASLVASDVPEGIGDARPPLDLVACVDHSGSMSGNKMKLMKETLSLLVHRAGLKERDRFGLVAFDHQVTEEVAIGSMDSIGRSRAAEAIARLQPRGATNLSGGLLKSIDVLCTAEGAASGRTRAVLLFTDGIANHGIRETDALREAVQGAIAEKSTSVFTFGFGADHNEDMLRSVAQTASGLYYYVQTADDIPQAFADALGGLTSVVAQNAVLSLEPAPGVAVARVLGNSYQRLEVGVEQTQTQQSIAIGDLYAEEEKDFLFELALPALTEPSTEPIPVACAKLRYFSVANKKMEEVVTLLRVARPAMAAEAEAVNPRLDEQRNRVLAAEAMETASRLADGGDIMQGRHVLELMRQRVAESISNATPLSQGLVAEIERLEVGYEDHVAYRSMGSKMSKMCAQSNLQQRSTHSSAVKYKAGGKSKKAMKTSWGVE